jgi:RNA polymerase sigma factor (sigma-70 family)
VKHDFARIVREHYSEVASYVRRRVLNPALADDLVQMTFLEALKSWDGGYKPEMGRPIAWLIGIAANVIRHNYRDEQRWLERYGRAALDVSVRADGWEDESIEAIDRRRRDATLARALATLPPQHREIITMHYWTELTCAEIGRVLEIPESLVKRRLEQARERIRAVLAALGVDRRG